METDTDEYRAAPRSPRQRRGVLDIVIAGLLFLGAIALFAGGLSFDRQSEAETQAFVAAPLCTSSAMDSETCRLNVPMLVTRRVHVPGTKGGGYFLDLLAHSGEKYKYQAEFRRSSRIWEAVSPGETVEAQLWHGRVVLVTVGTLWSKTVTNPSQSHLTHFFGVASGLLLLLALSFFVLICIQAARGQ